MTVPDNTPKVIFSHLKTDTRIDLLPFSPVEKFYLNLVTELSLLTERSR